MNSPRTYPLSASLEFLSACGAAVGAQRAELVAICTARDQPHHRVVAAAHLLRLETLCRAVVMLLKAGFSDEAATLARVLAEFAITAAWVGSDDERAWSLGLDLADSRAQGDALRKTHLNLPPIGRPIPGAKRRPPLREMAKQAGAEATEFFAGVYDLLSGPTHNGIATLGQMVDVESRRVHTLEIGGLAVQAASRLARYSLRPLRLPLVYDAIRIALQRWSVSWKSARRPP